VRSFLRIGESKNKFLEDDIIVIATIVSITAIEVSLGGSSTDTTNKNINETQ
jgi:hypothetical protein